MLFTQVKNDKENYFYGKNYKEGNKKRTYRMGKSPKGTYCHYKTRENLVTLTQKELECYFKK